VALKDNDRVSVLGWDFDVFAVPGHTLGHIAYYHHGLLFCGDTLFAAGCGRLFEGTPEQMHTSLTRLAALPEDTLVYCTHEYTLSNLKFAAAVEPGNPDTAARLEKVTAQREAGIMTLPSTLALEKLTNPFLRVDETSVKEKVDERNGTQNRAPSTVFAALRAWKDKF
jgi:hydroxyacylglutathione hydrolase